MSIQDQIEQIEALRDKAIAAYQRASALAEKHKKEAEDFITTIDVLSKISPTLITPSLRASPTQFYGGGDDTPSPRTSGPIHQRILALLQTSEKVWWTANEIQEQLAAKGDAIKMTSISPNLSRLKEGGDIVRDDLKVALADRAPKSAETPEDDLLGGNSSGESNDHDVTNRGTQPSSLVKPWAGGGT